MKKKKEDDRWVSRFINQGKNANFITIKCLWQKFTNIQLSNIT